MRNLTVFHIISCKLKVNEGKFFISQLKIIETRTTKIQSIFPGFSRKEFIFPPNFSERPKFEPRLLTEEFKMIYFLGRKKHHRDSFGLKH